MKLNISSPFLKRLSCAELNFKVMFVTKRIPLQFPGRCVDWSNNEGLMVVGGDSGLLKLIKIDENGDVVFDEPLKNHTCTKQFQIQSSN